MRRISFFTFFLLESAYYHTGDIHFLYISLQNSKIQSNVVLKTLKRSMTMSQFEL